MKTRKIISIFLMGIFLNFTIFSFAGCDWIVENYNVSSYSSQYTQEEHKERIKWRTIEKFATEFRSGKIVNCKVEILYSFYTDKPEYFLAEIEYKNPFDATYYEIDPNGGLKLIYYETKWHHIVGYIYEDVYYQGLIHYKQFVEGRNPYDVFGYEKFKKYYGKGQHAIEADGQKIRFYAGGYGDLIPPPELECNPLYLEKIVLTKEQEKDLTGEIGFIFY